LIRPKRSRNEAVEAYEEEEEEEEEEEGRKSFGPTCKCSYQDLSRETEDKYKIFQPSERDSNTGHSN
jgi:hypothetical protein